MLNGTLLTSKMLDMWEDMGKSEEGIGKLLGITRQGLWKIRKVMECPVRFRSDRGIERKSIEEKRANWNEYMRNWRKRNSHPGHAVVRVGGKLVKRSRHNAAIVLGRVLRDVEVVHHIDGDVRNDSYDNLVVFANQGDHLAHHRGESIKSVVE